MTHALALKFEKVLDHRYANWRPFFRNGWHERCAMSRVDNLMKSLSAKRIAILGLAIVLTSAGVSWALQRCLPDGESGDHVHPDQAESAFVMNNFEYSSTTLATDHRHQTASRIHCTESQILKLALGPASSAFRLQPPKDGDVRAFLAAALPKTVALNARPADSIYVSIKAHLSPHSLIPRFRI
jgi:hypothetical protein